MAKTPTNVARTERGYPYYTLASCLKLGEAVSTAGGRDVPKGIIAQPITEFVPAAIAPDAGSNGAIAVPLSGSGKYELASSSNHWVFSEAGGTVKLETPDPLPRALWERLKRYVDMLEPAKPNTEGGPT